MEPKREKAQVGVIVGRFQTPELHGAHVDLIRSVIERHPKTIVILGLSPAKATWNNPLDFESRKIMILEKFPEVTVLYIKDEKEDAVWSKRLDEIVKDVTGPGQTAVLYGGRDSFISHYCGKLNTIELESERFFSATEIREKVSSKVKKSPEFREGVIWATMNRFPAVFPTVDVAILNDDETQCLFGRKQNQTTYMFIGGFADPTLDKSYEAAAMREVSEETGLEITPPEYIGSCFIDDWRYRRERDKIITVFFKCKRVFGTPIPNDDIVETRWLGLTPNTRTMLGDQHLQLFDLLMNNLINKRLTGAILRQEVQF